ncbi:hypothetical protein [Phenylobacterium montanum]|uniref:Uncharacterized protein n=1 Tax=Phenylobacterium montanum TaxID=2823693 RepID=A0A975IU93_9CAUL|nr:hypothetical protein [Caulobacter sp. S6]QUD87284.1 hypothetical protein KCG34_19865 [Caulobacter sp. S6]
MPAKAARPGKSAPSAAPAVDVDWVANKILARAKQPRSWPLAVAIAIGAALLIVVAGGGWITWTVLSQVGPGQKAEASSAQPAQATAASQSADTGANPAPQPDSTPVQQAPGGAQVISAPASDQPLTQDQIVAVQKDTAEDRLKANLPESRGLTYRDVRTFIKGPVATNPAVFCGEFDSLNPAGARVGYQHFISSTENAKVETMMTPGEFNQAWRDQCAGPEGPKVWK